jgi:DNA-binding GntR family transcriptional regulator
MSRPDSKVVGKAYDGILFSIFTAEYSAGQSLPEEHLAARFSVSRSTIREALACLADDGLVEFKSKGGAQVRLIPRPEEVMASQEARFYFESLAGAELIRRLKNGRASLAEVEQLHSEMVEIKESTAHHSRQQKAEFLVKDFAFHLAIPRLAGCSFFLAPLNRILYSMRIQSLPIYLKYEELNDVVDEHRAMLEGLQKHDLDLFIVKTMEHLDHATSRWLGEEEAREPVGRGLESLCKAALRLEQMVEMPTSSSRKKPKQQ